MRRQCIGAKPMPKIYIHDDRRVYVNRGQCSLSKTAEFHMKINIYWWIQNFTNKMPMIGQLKHTELQLMITIFQVCILQKQQNC